MAVDTATGKKNHDEESIQNAHSSSVKVGGFLSKNAVETDEDELETSRAIPRKNKDWSPNKTGILELVRQNVLEDQEAAKRFERNTSEKVRRKGYILS